MMQPVRDWSNEISKDLSDANPGGMANSLADDMIRGPAKPLYEIQATLGGSGMASGIRLIAKPKLILEFGNSKLVNQTTHAVRYLEKLGLNTKAIKSKITKDIIKNIHKIEVGKGYKGSVTHKGIKINYSSFRRSEDLINIGSIRPPR